MSGTMSPMESQNGFHAKHPIPPTIRCQGESETTRFMTEDDAVRYSISMNAANLVPTWPPSPGE